MFLENQTISADFSRYLRTPLMRTRVDKYRQCATVKKVKQDAFVNRLFNGEKRNAIVYPTLLQAREDRPREFVIKKCTTALALNLRMKSCNQETKKATKSSKYANRLRSQVLGASRMTKSRGKLSCKQFCNIDIRRKAIASAMMLKPSTHPMLELPKTGKLQIDLLYNFKDRATILHKRHL